MTSTIKISSIELPEDDTYRLTKIEATGAYTEVKVGHSAVGGLHSNPIVLGQRCGVARSISSGVFTSGVTDIELTDDPAKILIHTESKSVYELTNLDMVKDNAVKKV